MSKPPKLHEAGCPKTARRIVSYVVGRRELGMAWAGNTINTVIFRHHGVLTRDGKQYLAYFEDHETLVVGQRDLESGHVVQSRISGRFNVDDAHNSISIGVDSSGILHLCYDQHGHGIRYRRGLAPHSIETFSDEIPMTGAYEHKLTYPTFLFIERRSKFLFLCRDGSYKSGTARLKSYDESDQVWADFPEPILSGSLNRPWTSNAYWNSPVIGPDGTIHLSFVWRTDPIGGPLGLINNINIGYARSPDLGRSWETSRGVPIQLPMTQINAETIWAVSPGSNLINQCSMALDHLDNPHIVYYANDDDGIIQYQHLWFDGKKWKNDVISKRQAQFTLRGGGTLQTPLSRPDLLIDREGNAFVFFRSDETDNRLAVIGLLYPDYTYDPNNTRVIIDMDLGWSEPVIDRERWRQSNIASVYAQHCDQPDGDSNPQSRQTTAYLYDLIIAFTPRGDSLRSEGARVSDTTAAPPAGKPREDRGGVDALERRINQWRLASYGRDAGVVVYTATIGTANGLKVPEHLNPEWDYVCFTDRADYPGNHPWQIRPMTFIDADPTRSIGYVRANPHQYLADYHYSIWIDAAILIKDDVLEGFLETFERSGLEIAASGDSTQISVDLVNGVPDRSIEDVLIRQHNAESARRLARTWWTAICRASRPEGVSFAHVIHETGLSWWPMLEAGLSTRSHPSFGFFPSSPPLSYKPPSFLPAAYVEEGEPYWRRLSPGFRRGELEPFREIPVEIVICGVDALSSIQTCLRSVVEHRLPGHSIVLVDDGTDPEAADWMTRQATLHPWLKRTRHVGPTGHTGRARAGISATDAPFVILLDSSAVVSGDWVLKLLQVAMGTPDIGMVGPMSNAASWQSIPALPDPANRRSAAGMPSGQSVEDMDRLCERYGYGQQFPLVPLIDGFCCGVKRAVFDAVGSLDAKSFPNGYGAAEDLGIRATDAGFSLAVATHCFVFCGNAGDAGPAARGRSSKSAITTLSRRHGSSRIASATATMAANPILAALRESTTMALGLQSSAATL